MGDRIGTYRVSMERPEGKRPFARTNLNGKRILKCVFKKWEEQHGLD